MMAVKDCHIDRRSFRTTGWRAGDTMSSPAEPGVVGESPDLAPQLERVAAPLRTQVSDILRREIVEMRLHPGQRLVERELIERIGVSRTTIREALRELAAEGLVTTIPQKGAIVAIPSPKEAAEVYEVRALLEGLAAREFVSNASQRHMEALRESVSEVSTAGEADDADGVLRAKNRFYDVLFDGADNATIRSILGGLQARVAVLRATSLTAPGRPRQSVAEIRAILEAIERRDGDEAAEAASFHVRQAAETAFRQIGIAPLGEGAVDA
jgi:DNA-binding GntR family transcriptional regulator